MPYAKNGDVNIYYEVEGEGKPLMLAHALTGNLQSWKNSGYPNALKEDYRLILFDARGHGESDKPHSVDAYTPELMSSDVLAVLDATRTNQTHYFGYSMGSKIGFWLATHYPEFFHSFILAGMTPYGFSEEVVNRLNGIAGLRRMQISDPDAYIQRIQSQVSRPLSNAEKNVHLSGDPQALVAAIEGFIHWTPLTNEDLSGISQPCLVYCGEEDEGGFHNATKDCVNHMPNAKYISFPGLGHLQAQFNIDVVLPPIREFLESVDK